MKSSQAAVRSVDLVNLLLGLVHVLDRSVRMSEEIIADEHEIGLGGETRVDRDAHVGRDRDGLVVAQERPLDHVVALAVAVEPLLGWRPPAFHERVVSLVDVRAGGARSERGIGPALNSGWTF